MPLTLSIKCFSFRINYTIIFSVLFLSTVLNTKCILCYQRRGIYRVIRKTPMSLLPPKTASAHFSMAYDLPPFLTSPPPQPLSTLLDSYGAPAYPPALSNQSPPSSSYGVPSNSYGPPSSTTKPIIHKHIYVHVPPPEPDIQTSKAPLTAPPPQKHYKIVFIKAPTPPRPTAPKIPVQLPDEEKTLVYVLIKRPEDPPDIVIPTPPSTPPSKPEVYFIRYKTQNEENGGPYPTSMTLGPPLASYGAPDINITSGPPTAIPNEYIGILSK